MSLEIQIVLTRSDSVDTSSSTDQTSLSSTRVSQVKKTWQNLLGITIAGVVVYSILFLTDLVSQLRFGFSKMNSLQVISLVDKIFTIILHGIGIYAVQRYSTKGLILFAWLTILKLGVIIYMTALFIWTGISINAFSILKENIGWMTYVVAAFLGFLYLVGFIFWISVIRMAFELVQLKTEKQYSHLQQA